MANSSSVYYPAYGKLVPANVGQADLPSGKYDDPLKNITYAVSRIGTRQTKLDPTVQFGS